MIIVPSFSGLVIIGHHRRRYGVGHKPLEAQNFTSGFSFKVKTAFENPASDAEQ